MKFNEWVPITMIEILTIVNVIATVVTAVATGLLAFLTYRYVKLTNSILTINKEAIFEQTRPYIVVQIESENHWIDLIIKNIGNRPAKDVSIEFDPPLSVLSAGVKEDQKMDYQPMLKQKFFAPNHRLHTAIFPTSTVVDDPNCAKIFQVRIRYSDTSGCSFDDSYTLDLSSYIYPRKEAMMTNTYYLKDFSSKVIEQMKKMNDSLSIIVSLANNPQKQKKM